VFRRRGVAAQVAFGESKLSETGLLFFHFIRSRVVKPGGFKRRGEKRAERGERRERGEERRGEWRRIEEMRGEWRR
jgi:hypothetical protein